MFLARSPRSEEHTSELQSRLHLVCRLLLEKKKPRIYSAHSGGFATARFTVVCHVHRRGQLSCRRRSRCVSRSLPAVVLVCCFFFFNDTATTEIYPLSLHDALPICARPRCRAPPRSSSGRRASARG